MVFSAVLEKKIGVRRQNAGVRILNSSFPKLSGFTRDLDRHCKLEFRTTAGELRPVVAHKCRGMPDYNRRQRLRGLQYELCGQD